MNHLLEKIKQKNASAFTHSGRFLKTMKVLFLILAEDSMIIIRKTAVSAIMASHMRPSAFSGRSLDRKS